MENKERKEDIMMFSASHCPDGRKARTMNEPNKKLSVRAFVALMIGFCGIGLPVTGVLIHLNEFSPVLAAGHAWHSSHNVLGVLFVVFSVWHIVLNRRPLWNYIRSKALCVPSVSREFVLACIIFASLLVVFVGHEFLAYGH